MKGGFLLPLLFSMYFVFFYPMIILMIIFYIGGGPISWLIIGLLLAPVIAIFYCVEYYRMKGEMERMKLEKTIRKELEEVIEEYKKIIEERGKKSE